jgi:hypothetical protein
MGFIFVEMSMKKKVNTLTFHGVLNHGAILQAYALQKFLVNNGYQSELVNYKPLYFMWQIFRPAKSIKKTLLKYKRIKKFKNFSDNHLQITKKMFFSKKDIEKNLDYCDVIICGSDQIWNKNLTGGSVDAVFLQKYKHSAKKIAYAASAGANILSGDPEACKALSEFHALGIRESHLAYDVSKMEDVIEPFLVVDPTLLLGKMSYHDICHSKLVPREKFIVSYEVGTDETRRHYDLFVSKIKNSLGLPVFHIGDKPISSADRNLLNISPSDWVSFFDSCEVVVTNSFHGTAFGVNFRKPLFVVSHCDESKNVRLESFLKKVGMDQCLLSLADRFDEGVVAELLQNREYTDFNDYVDGSKRFLLESLT